MKRANAFLSVLTAVGIGSLISCGDSSTNSDTANADDLIGTWIEVDSTPELSSTGDTSYLSRDTVYTTFSKDGSFIQVQRLWSKDVYSPMSDGQYHLSSGVYRGTWSVSGNQLTTTIEYDGEAESSTKMFSVSGSTLTLTSKKSSKSVVHHRYDGVVPGASAN